MIRRPPRSTLSSSSAASDVYKRQGPGRFVLARGRVRRQGEDVPVVGDGPSACPDRPGRAVLVHGSAPVMTVGVDLSLIHISEPTRLLSISYAVFCLKKKTKHTKPIELV